MKALTIPQPVHDMYELLADLGLTPSLTFHPGPPPTITLTAHAIWELDDDRCKRKAA